MKTLAFMLMLCTYASAQTVGLHIGSQHTPDMNANNLNPGMYVRLDNGATAGFYKNSVNRDSVYVGWTTPEFYRVSATFGLINGYYRENWIPMVVPTARIYTDGAFSARIAYIPKIDEKGAEVWHFMIERKF